MLTPLALLTWAAPSLVLLVSVASGLAVLLIPYPDRYAARWGLDELDAVVVVGAASASALKHRHARLLPAIDEHLRRRYPGALLLAHARDKRLMRAYSGRYDLEAAGDGIMRGRIPTRGEPTASEPGNEAD